MSFPVSFKQNCTVMLSFISYRVSVRDSNRDSDRNRDKEAKIDAEKDLDSDEQTDEQTDRRFCISVLWCDECHTNECLLRVVNA